MNDLMQALTAWDRRVFVEINHGLKNPFFDAIMPRISDLGLGHIQVLFILVCFLLVAVSAGEIHGKTLFRDIQGAFIRRRSWIVPLLLAFAISGLGATAFKHTVERDRPAWFYVHEHGAGRSLDVQVETVAGRRPLRVRGFLSGHTATSVALATAGTILFIRRKRLFPLVLAGWLLAGLISLSRIYIADHWPIDVVCGTILGILSGVAAVAIYRIRAPLAKPAATVKEDSAVAADKSAAIG